MNRLAMKKHSSLYVWNVLRQDNRFMTLTPGRVLVHVGGADSPAKEDQLKGQMLVTGT
jgi:hypothetical protein